MVPIERPPGGRPTKAKILELDADLKRIERELYRVREQDDLPRAIPVKAKKKQLWKNRPWAPPLMLD